jgi:hypothetical protein
MRFYSEDVNPAQYIPAVMWNEASSDKLADLYAMILMLTKNSNSASEVILGSDVAQAVLDDAKIQKLLDINNYNIGEINPITLPQEAARLGRLNIRGRWIDLLTYDGSYVDEETGVLTSYVPAKKIAVTAPNAGRALYGAVSQMEQDDGLWHTYMGRRVPRYWSEKDGRELTVSSRPLFVPRTKNPFITAEVLK